MTWITFRVDGSTKLPRGTKYRQIRSGVLTCQFNSVLVGLRGCAMDRLLVIFIRQRMTGRVDFDLGEIFDAAEQYFRTKLDARAFFDALCVVLRERRQETRSRLRHSAMAAASSRQLPVRPLR